MLGVGSGASWRFFAGGKHPCAKDYLHLGTETPISASLKEWVRRGFAARKVGRRVGAPPMVWRFWLRGGGGEIVCGVLRESCDSIGRSFPLLLVGGGRMQERPWQELPLYLSKLWLEMEKLSAPGARDVENLEQGLSALPAPPEEYRSGADREAGGEFRSGKADQLCGPERLHDAQGFLLLQLQHGVQEGAAFEEEVVAAGGFLSERILVPPVGIFIGGENGGLRYGVLTRPLRNMDFCVIWESLTCEQIL